MSNSLLTSASASIKYSISSGTRGLPRYGYVKQWWHHCFTDVYWTHSELDLTLMIYFTRSSKRHSGYDHTGAANRRWHNDILQLSFNFPEIITMSCTAYFDGPGWRSQVIIDIINIIILPKFWSEQLIKKTEEMRRPLPTTSFDHPVSFS